MSKPLLRRLKLNDLEYNANRDPQVYRRCANMPFRIEAVLDGAGHARCTLRDASGRVLAEKTVPLPGTFTHELAFETPGTRVVTLSVQSAAAQLSRDLRLDVLDHPWVG